MSSAKNITKLNIRKVLNVGGNSKETSIPEYYSKWEHILLDIDPKGKPDVICDARKMLTLPKGEYDTVYCSHNLEHFYKHDVPKVLKGFLHVLKDDGFAHIRVPDMQEIMEMVVRKGLDITDFLYDSPEGPITVMDAIYGYGIEIEKSGKDYYAHKTGFSPKSLFLALKDAGFEQVFLAKDYLESIALAFKTKPNEEDAKIFKLKKIL